MATASMETTDPEAIRLEWRQARGGSPSTATMNFIVYVENPKYRDWVVDRAQRIADKHPSRMIVLEGIAGKTGAQVEAGDPNGEGPAVFRERVDIGVDGVRAAERMHLVQSLLVSNVPVVLWWAADRLFTSNTFAALLPVSEHVILDSSGTGTDPAAIREFASYFASGHDCFLRDLAWMRLDPWRDVIAQFFDDPAMRDELFRIRKIEVASGSDAEALYLGAWLGTRLAWTVRDGSTFCDRAAANIPFERTREGEIRRVQRVTITTDSSTYSAYVSGEDAVALEATGRHAKGQRHVPLQAIDNTSLIERAILTKSGDEIFVEALRMVGALLN